MARMHSKRIGGSFLVAALAAILVLGGVLAACAKTQTTTSSTAASSTTSTASTVKTSTTSATTTAMTSTTSTATAVSAADFYKNNLVTIVCPYGPGGGVDIAARLFANFWTEATGGRMVVVNKEGAGGLFGENYAYTAKADGLTIGLGIHGSTLIIPTLAQDPGVKFDLKKMNWIKFTNQNLYTLGISPKLPNSMAELSKVSGLKFASVERYGGGTFGPALVIDIFGLKDARIVVGYSSSAEALLAVAKGEVDGHNTSDSTVLDAANKGQAKPILTLDLERSPYFKDIPAIPELLKLSAEQDSLLRTLAAFKPGQVFWLQPGVPQDRIEFVRNAFDKIAAMDGFLKQSLPRWPIYVPPVSGKDYAAEMEKTLAVATPDRFNALKQLVDKYIR